MNVLIVNKYFHARGGPERYMMSVIDLLQRDGHKVIPLALRFAQNDPSPYSSDFLNPPSGEHSGQFSEFALNLRKRIHLTLRSIYSLRARRKVAKIVQREKIDVVYLINICNYISPSVIDGARAAGARVAMFMLDFNFVCSSYHFLRDGQVCTLCTESLANAVKHRCMRGSLALSAARALAMKAHRLMGIYQRVDAFVAPSRFMAETLARFGMPRDRVHYVPGFIDSETFNPERRTGEYVLFHGRLDEDKGVEGLLEAWRKLGATAPPLWIAGRGENEASLRERAKDLPVHFTGFLGVDRLVEVIRNARVAVAPSLWPDNAPMSVFEAMACGKPVVGSRLGGICDQVDDGVSGLLVSPGDAAELGRAIMKLWRDPELAERMGKAGLRRMESEFSPENHLKALCDLFRAPSDLRSGVE